VGAVAVLPEGVKVTVSKAPHSAAGGSILGLMMLGAAKGDTVEVAVEGDNADAVLADLVALIANGFGEE
jgi:phosphocarrier protein HPr